MNSIKTLLAAALVAGSATVAFAEGVDRSDANVYNNGQVAVSQQAALNFPAEMAAFQASVRTAPAQNVVTIETGRTGADR